MSLVIESEDGADEPVFLIEGGVTDSLTCPATKPAADGADEEQDTKGQPGWWFLMANRGFRPLAVSPSKAPFPNKGKRRLTLQLSYGKSVVMRVRGLFDFNFRTPPDNAKIHVDRNHAYTRTASEVSSSQGTNGSQGTPTSSEPSDNLFLRTQNRMLTAVRLFAPYTVLVKHPMLSSWLADNNRLVRMLDTAKQEPVAERSTKRQRRDPVVATGASIRTSQTEISHFMEVEEEAPRLVSRRSLQSRLRLTATPAPTQSNALIEIDVDDSPVQPRPTRAYKAINSYTTTTTTTTSTATTTTETTRMPVHSPTIYAFRQPTTTTREVTYPRRRAPPKPGSSDFSEDELRHSPDESVESEEEEEEEEDDDEDDAVSDGESHELDLDLTPLDLGLGAGATPRRGRGRPKGSTNKVTKAPKTAAVRRVAPKTSPAPKRPGRPRLRALRDEEQEEEPIDVVELEDDDINQRRRSTKKPYARNVSNNDGDVSGGGQEESSVAEALLAPAMPSDVFVWHSSQQASQLSQNPTETVEEIDSSQFVLERDLLGSGSFARVYKAQYKGVDVAVKVFKPSESATRIDNELRILSKLRGHTNVVRVVGYCVVNDHKQIAMEFCAFGNLHERIQSLKRSGGGRGLRRRMTARAREFEKSRLTSRRGRAATTSLLTKRKRGDDTADAEEEESASPQDPFEPIKQRRGDIIVGIARGMQHLHNNNVCHRDLSSMNVLVDSNWVPKIADFGLSTVDVNEMKGMGVFKNKPKKCQDQFKAFYTNSSDVYSFAIIVWELFHLGEVPWEGELDNDVKRKVMQGERPKIAPDVPRVWRKLIEQCWIQDPDRRPSFANIVRYLEANGFGSSSSTSSS